MTALSKLVVLLLLIGSCGIIHASEQKIPLVAECVGPETAHKFKYTGATSFKVEDGNLILTTPASQVIYRIPSGFACEVRPVMRDFSTENNTNNDGQD